MPSGALVNSILIKLFLDVASVPEAEILLKNMHEFEVNSHMTVSNVILADAVSIPVIASGGVAGMADVTVFDGTSVNGVIIGRALYDGRINLAEAISHRQAG